jgi:hypothetical protein
MKDENFSGTPLEFPSGSEKPTVEQGHECTGNCAYGSCALNTADNCAAGHKN